MNGVTKTGANPGTFFSINDSDNKEKTEELIIIHDIVINKVIKEEDENVSELNDRLDNNKEIEGVKKNEFILEILVNKTDGIFKITAKDLNSPNLKEVEKIDKPVTDNNEKIETQQNKDKQKEEVEETKEIVDNSNKEKVENKETEEKIKEIQEENIETEIKNEPENYSKALPGLQWVNNVSKFMWNKLNNKEGYKIVKPGYYLGYRLVSLIVIPTNIISMIGSVFGLIMVLPFTFRGASTSVDHIKVAKPWDDYFADRFSDSWKMIKNQFTWPCEAYFILYQTPPISQRIVTLSSLEKDYQTHQIKFTKFFSNRYSKRDEEFFNKCARMLALQKQEIFGNFTTDEKKSDYFDSLFNFISDDYRKFNKDGDLDLLSLIQTEWKKLKNVTKKDAQKLFIDLMKSSIIKYNL